MFYLTTHSTHFIYGDMGGRKEMFYLTTHSTHFIYGYMASAVPPKNEWTCFVLTLFPNTLMFFLSFFLSYLFIYLFVCLFV